MKSFFSKQKKNKESGQSALEFVLVFPVFLFIFALIVDYGWLFYIQIGMENSARNAARVACVEYTQVALDDNNKYPDSQLLSNYYTTDGLSTKYQETLKEKISEDKLTNTYWVQYKISNSTGAITKSSGVATQQEIDIINEVKNTIPSSLTDVEVYLSYTYDNSYKNSEITTFKPTLRSNGDVYVIVAAYHHALTDLVNFDRGEDRRNVPIVTHSVYKVEPSGQVEATTVATPTS